MADRTCYGRDPCMHVGPCVDFWADEGMCVCTPVDADHYPGSSGILYCGVNVTGNDCNLRTFLDGVEVYRYDIPSRDDCAWISQSWSGGYSAELEFAFYNGNSKRWSHTCMVGDMKPAEGEIISIDVPSEAKENAGIDLCTTIKNVGGTEAKFFLRFYDIATMIHETSPGWVQPGQTIEDICEYFNMPGYAWSGKIELVRQE